MSSPVQITSTGQFNTLLSSSRVVVVNFYDQQDPECQSIGPLYDQLAGQLARPNIVTFTKVNAEQQTSVAQTYSISTLPTFMIFKNGREVSRIRGAKTQELSEAISRLATEALSDGSSGGFGEASSSTGGPWLGAGLPRGYNDVTVDAIDTRGLDLLNVDSDFGDVRTLFAPDIPSTLADGKGKAAASGKDSKKDWVESDVDEQLMLYIPFTSTLKVHTIQLTSIPPKSDDDEDAPMRPKTIRLYTNKQHNLGFEEADDIPATQIIELKPSDWDEKTGTAKLELRFVKFQNITSLVLFVIDGDGEGEKVRLDRIRIIGDTGEKREMGQLKKVGDDE